MARFRSLKSDLRTRLEASDWQDHVAGIAAMSGKETVGPLLSFLLLGGEVKWRAAVALGRSVAVLADTDMEDARVVLRRLMWHMNEESGNIGWGIPEAMAEILACHRGLAKEYHRILISYVRDTEKDNNFCDHAPLRRSCFWSVGRLAQAWPDLASDAWEPLLAGLDDEDPPCRGASAWAIGQLLRAEREGGGGAAYGPERFPGAGGVSCRHARSVDAAVTVDDLGDAAARGVSCDGVRHPCRARCDEDAVLRLRLEEGLQRVSGDAAEVEVFEGGAVRNVTSAYIAGEVLDGLANP